MKKITLAIIAIIAISISSQAQNIDTVWFKSHPIDGLASDFIKLLESDGFIKGQPTHTKTVSLKGNVSGIDSCLVFVTPAENTGKVYYLTIHFPVVNNWTDIRNQYLIIKDALISKYGPCMSSNEGFLGSYSEGEEMKALSEDKVHYTSMWGKDMNITLTISKSKSIRLRYKNVANEKESLRITREKLAKDL
ncbi:MAG: hypothetical protein MJZ62_05385 [Bacteroidales bacterium]|nr:hypothetical protein [Bacteroidales bacterium]